MDTGGVSPGEIGGVFAGIVALLATFGKGFAWLVNLKGARENSRAARLAAWEKSLDRREEEQRAEQARARAEAEERMHTMERRMRLLSAALFEMVAEVQRLDPDSAALAKARGALIAAYPVEPELPEDMAWLAERAQAKAREL